METYRLICHPDTPALKVRSVDAYVVRNRDSYLHFRWRIKGTRQLVAAPWQGSSREHGLWQTTCFEIFLRKSDGDAYHEFNFSPSGQWAAFDFMNYRAGMADRAIAQAPHCSVRSHGSILTLDAQIRAAQLPPRPWQIALSAVIEELDGTKSYWALAHPPGKPDFHHPTCFAATLAPPSLP